MEHADAVFLGEAEGRFDAVIRDLERGKLKKFYDYSNDYPEMKLIGTARRDILDRSAYNFRGVQMVDLVHASRGCRFNCFPCCTPFLGGRKYRPRPMDRVAEELGLIEGDRMFVVDNSLAQDRAWEIELFKTMIPFKKKWCCHPIQDDDEVLELAVQGGAWYVYQAVVDKSDYIRRRIQRYKSFGIGVEGTIILGTDEMDEDYIKEFVDFLMEIELDLAEFTVLTPFAHTRIREELQQQGRILTDDYAKYDAGTVVFQPKHMSPQRLQELYHYAWETFYKDEPQSYKMYRLFQKIQPPRARRTRLKRDGAGSDA